MSISRTPFRGEMSMCNCRNEQLLKAKGILMPNHSSPLTTKTTNCKFARKTRSPHKFHFDGNGGDGFTGENGEYFKFIFDTEKCEKDKENKDLKDRTSSVSNFKRAANNIQKKCCFPNEFCIRNSQYARISRGNHCGADCKKIYIETEQQSETSSVNQVKETISENDLDSRMFNIFKENVTEIKQNNEFEEESISGIMGSCSIASSEMNYLILCGLFLGIITSKFLQLIYRYFCWFLEHALYLRNIILGPNSLADLFNIEDNSRFSLRSKILLVPLISVFCLIYSTIKIFNGFLYLLLSQAPRRLVKLIRKWYKN